MIKHAKFAKGAKLAKIPKMIEYAKIAKSANFAKMVKTAASSWEYFPGTSQIGRMPNCGQTAASPHRNLGLKSFLFVTGTLFRVESTNRSRISAAASSSAVPSAGLQKASGQLEQR